MPEEGRGERPGSEGGTGQRGKVPEQTAKCKRAAGRRRSAPANNPQTKTRQHTTTITTRANTHSYDRWWQARCSFGAVTGGAANIVRQVATWSDDPVLIRQTQKWAMAMVYGMIQVRGERV